VVRVAVSEQHGLHLIRLEGWTRRPSGGSRIAHEHADTHDRHLATQASAISTVRFIGDPPFGHTSGRQRNVEAGGRNAISN
jgi:hypothetical protein